MMPVSMMRMIRSLTLAIVLVVLVVMLTGCNPFGPGGGDISPINVPQVRVGTDGVVSEFIANSPPDEVFEQSDMLVRFSLHNKGATNVQRGAYALESSPGAFFVFHDTTDGTFMIDGRKDIDPFGQKSFFEVPVGALALPANLETISERLTLHTCYPYSTMASVTVCVDTAVGDVRDAAKVCTEGAVSSGSAGQGGPISLTSVTLQSVPLDEFRARPQVELTFTNAGHGEIMLPHESDALCTGRTVQSANKARVQVYLSERSMQCSPAELTFKDGTATLQCTLPDGIEKIQGTFYSILRADIDYGYHEVTTRSVRIKKIPR